MLMTENTKGWYPRTKERPGYEITGEKGDAGEDQVWKYCEEEGLEYETYYDRYSQVNRKIDGKINGKLVDVKNNGWQFEGEGFWHKIELDKSKKGDGKGWLNTSEAEEIWVVFEGVERFVKYNVPKMRKYIAKLIEDKPHRYKRLSKKEGNTAYGVNVNFDYVPGRLWDGIDARDKKNSSCRLMTLKDVRDKLNTINNFDA